jgi:hypothetical protein
MFVGPVERDGGSEGNEEVLKRDWGVGGNELVAKTGPRAD